MAAILNSAILDLASAMLESDIFFSSLRFTQKHSYSTLTLTQTNLIWLKTHLFSPNLMMAVILNSAILISTILDSAILVFPLLLIHTSLPTICTKKLHSFILTQLDDGGHLDFCHIEFCHLGIQLLHCGIQTPCFLLSDSLKNTLTPL